ncbi:MAG: helix-turn-helix domain-containing protein [Vicinamibacterales bacterium]
MSEHIRERRSGELLKVRDAAEYLGIRPWTLRHWISDRKIDVVKYGNGSVRIRQSVLDHFLADCTIKAKAHHGRRTQEPRLLEGPGVGSSDESVAG